MLLASITSPNSLALLSQGFLAVVLRTTKHMATATTAATAATPASTEAPQYAIFADWNTASFEARVMHTELKAGGNGEYVAVTCVTNLKDGEDGIAIRFTSAAGILKLAKGGHLPKGRRVHLVGSIAGFESAYTNADGLVVPLARPRLSLQGVSLTLGAKPKAA